MKPAQNLVNRFHRRPVGDSGPVDQDHRQVQRTRGIKLGARTRAAGVLGDDMADAVRLQQGKITSQGEGAARYDRLGIGQRQLFGHIDQAKKVVVLGLGGEGCKLLASDGEEDAGRSLRQGPHGSGKVWDVLPAVTGAGVPGLALQRDQGKAGKLSGSLDSIRQALNTQILAGKYSTPLGDISFDKEGEINQKSFYVAQIRMLRGEVSDVFSGKFTYVKF